MVLGAEMVTVTPLGDSEFSFIGDLMLTSAMAGIGLTLWQKTAPARTSWPNGRGGATCEGGTATSCLSG